MNNKVVSVTSEIWNSLAKSCKLFTSACGFVAAGVFLVNAVKPQTFSDIKFMHKPDAAAKD